MARKKIERVGLTTEKYLRSLRGEGIGGGQKTRESLAYAGAQQVGTAFNPSQPAALAPAPGQPPPVAPNPFLRGSLAAFTGGGAPQGQPSTNPYLQSTPSTNPYLQRSPAPLAGGGGRFDTESGPIAGVRGVGTVTPRSQYLDVRMAQQMEANTRAAEWKQAQNAALAGRTANTINALATPVLEGLSAQAAANTWVAQQKQAQQAAFVSEHMAAKTRAAQQKQEQLRGTWGKTFSPGFGIQNPWRNNVQMPTSSSVPGLSRTAVQDPSGRQIWLNGVRRLSDGKMVAKDDAGRDVIYDPQTRQVTLAPQGTAGVQGTAQMPFYVNPVSVFRNTHKQTLDYNFPVAPYSSNASRNKDLLTNHFPANFRVANPPPPTAGGGAYGGGFGGGYGGGGGGYGGYSSGGSAARDFGKWLMDLVNWNID